jgi:hypothetical protein
MSDKTKEQKAKETAEKLKALKNQSTVKLPPKAANDDKG